MKYLFSPKKKAHMHKKQRLRMIDRHRSSLNHHGYSPNALFWSSRGIQKTRFKVLSEIGVHSGDSLLDVGCGFGDLFNWLGSHDLATDYTGLDLSQEILDKAIEVNPQLHLLHGELFDFDWPMQSFDWVFLSGTLNWNLDDKGAYARRVITRMFELCRHGVAFNMLDIRKLNTTALGDLFAYDPDDILDFCQGLSDDCQLRSGYLDNDFTVYMKRS
ncbi:MAG: class I SAM-dependent methyltransferase [Mariprofundaceae bacterium]